MRPRPTTPKVAPLSSRPRKAPGSVPAQRPDRRSASASAVRRAAARVRLSASSAVALVSTSGVFVTTTPRRRQSSRSMLSYPTPKLAMTRSWGPAASSSCSPTSTVGSATIASTPGASASKASGATSRPPSLIKQLASRRSVPAGGSRRAISTVGVTSSRSSACESIRPMRVAVVGHVEWVEFARGERVPEPGEIVQAREGWEEPAGGGAVAAGQLARLAGVCLFLTALGDDELGRRAKRELEALGVRVEAAWRPEPQRWAFVHLDTAGERTITVLGERFGPNRDDPLPW